MKTTFGSAGTSRIKSNILSALAVLLFLAALVCVIIALVRSPEAPPVSDPSADKPSSGDDTPTKPAPPTGSVKTISEYALPITYQDESGSAAIETVTDILLRELIAAASNSDTSAFKVTKILSVTPALFNHTQDTSSVCASPLSANVWFVSSRAKVEFTGNLTVDSEGEVFLGGRYIVRSGKTYTLYEQAEYEAMPPQDIPTFVWGEYDASTTIGAEEMTMSCGIKLGSVYSVVESKMNGFDSVTDTDSRTKTATKAGYTFTFTLVDAGSNSANDYGLPHDGEYHLTYIVADETCLDEFPRGIKIGDSIEDVFTKFPAANTKLQQWKEQRLYGAYENTEGKVYCFLEYRTYLASYRIIAQDTGREHIAISFSKANGSDPNKVNSFEWFME
jgi:hypothetical protein